MAYITCSKCDNVTKRNGFPLWVWIVSIIFFPIGLLSLLAGRKTTQCPQCGRLIG
jgi:hypothetical protein